MSSWKLEATPFHLFHLVVGTSEYHFCLLYSQGHFIFFLCINVSIFDIFNVIFSLNKLLNSCCVLQNRGLL